MFASEGQQHTLKAPKRSGCTQRLFVREGGRPESARVKKSGAAERSAGQERAGEDTINQRIAEEGTRPAFRLSPPFASRAFPDCDYMQRPLWKLPKSNNMRINSTYSLLPLA